MNKEMIIKLFNSPIQEDVMIAYNHFSKSYYREIKGLAVYEKTRDRHYLSSQSVSAIIGSPIPYSIDYTEECLEKFKELYERDNNKVDVK